MPTGWAAGTGDGYSITDGQLVLAGSPNWGSGVILDPNLRESGKYIIGWDYTTQGTSFGDYGLFLKLLDSADMSQVHEVFSHMGDGQIHLGNQQFWNITLPTSRMELEVDVDTKEWQLYIDGIAVTNEGGSGVGTWTESLAIGFMNYQHGTCKIDNVTVKKVVEEPEEPTYVPGDADDNGIVEARDIILIRRHIAGGYNVEINVDASDVDKNGLIEAKDIILVRRFIAGGYGVELK